MKRCRFTAWLLPGLVTGLLIIPQAPALTRRALPAPAQQTAATAPDMAHPPQVGPIPNYRPPASVQDQLPNGLHIIVVEDHRLPLVTLRLALHAGSSQVQLQDAGLADAEADLLTAGSPGRNARQIAEAAAGYGGQIDAEAGSDFLIAGTSGLSNRADAMFALFSAVVLHPTFPENEVTLRKANMLQELQLSRSDPNYLAHVRFSQLLWGRHPYSIVTPTEASIARIDRPQLLAFHQRLFLPNNDAVLVVVGDIRSGMARSLAQQYFGQWQFGTPPAPPNPAPPVRTSRRIFIVDRPGSAQSTIMLGNLGLTRLAPDYFPFLVANEVLGGSFNSRLVADIREQKGFAYGIGSRDVPKLQHGAWTVVTQVRTPVTMEALQAILAQLEKIRTGPVSPTELQQAKQYLAGSFIRQLQTQAGVADQFLNVQLYHLPQDYLATWVERVDAVDAAEAEKSARTTVHPDTELIVVVGDAKAIETKLANLAPGGMITIYNARGEVIGTYPHTGVHQIPAP